MNEIRIQEIIKTEDSIQARIFINENEEIIKTGTVANIRGLFL